VFKWKALSGSRLAEGVAMVWPVRDSTRVPLRIDAVVSVDQPEVSYRIIAPCGVVELIAIIVRRPRSGLRVMPGFTCRCVGLLPFKTRRAGEGENRWDACGQRGVGRWAELVGRARSVVGMS